MIRQEEVYRIGRIGKPHGVGGELTFAFDDDVFDRCDAEYLVLDIDGILVPFFMESYRFNGSSSALVKFCGIDSQERARDLTGCAVFFPRKLSDSTDDELSWAEIVGFTLIDENSGSTVGTIRSVDDSTANLLFEVDSPEGEQMLIPANEDLIDSFDADRCELRMRLPEGLLDLHRL